MGELCSALGQEKYPKFSNAERWEWQTCSVDEDLSPVVDMVTPSLSASCAFHNLLENSRQTLSEGMETFVYAAPRTLCC